MERYRNFVRIEQLKENIRSGKTDAALELAQQLDPTKVKSNSDLNILADLYLENGMLAKASECLTQLYGRRKTRSVLMQLVNLSVRLKRVNEAEKYFREFKALAPGDFYNYIFRYNIDKIEGKPYETLIVSLEKLKDVEYIDSWAYELAKLYHKSGLKEKCVKECEDILTWFGDGEYVDRARALKAYYSGELDFNDNTEASANKEAETDTPEDAEPEASKLDIDEPDTAELDTTESEASEPDAVESEVIEIKNTEAEDVNDTVTEAVAAEDIGLKEITDSEPETAELKEDEPECVKPESSDEPAPEETVEEVVKEEKNDNGDIVPAEEKAFDCDVDEIELAADVFAEIEGLEDYHEEEPVKSDVIKEPENDAVEETVEEAVEFGVPELASHDFKGLRASVIAKDSLLEAFLAKTGTSLEEYFGFFAYQEEVRTQLIKVLEILLNPQIKNISLAISGEHNSGIKGLIKGITRILYHSGFLNGQQVAFTDAGKINAMKLSEKTDKLIGCCLAINNAGGLSGDAAQQLLKADEVFAGKTAVVLIDYRSELNRLFRDNRELNSMFPLRIHIPAFDRDDMEDLVFFKLNEGNYRIEKSAYELVQKELRRIARDVHEGKLVETDRYISEILDRVETRKAKNLLEGDFKITVDSGENIITAEDLEKTETDRD